MVPSEDTNVPSGDDTDNSEACSEMMITTQHTLTPPPPPSLSTATCSEGVLEDNADDNHHSENDEGTRLLDGDYDAERRIHIKEEVNDLITSTVIIDQQPPQRDAVPPSSNGSVTNNDENASELTKPPSDIQKAISFLDDLEEGEKGVCRISSSNSVALGSVMTGVRAHPQNHHHHLEPEGLWKGGAKSISRRFDEEMLKEVMEDEQEKLKEEKQRERNIEAGIATIQEEDCISKLNNTRGATSVKVSEHKDKHNGAATGTNLDCIMANGQDEWNQDSSQPNYSVRLSRETTDTKARPPKNHKILSEEQLPLYPNQLHANGNHMNGSILTREQSNGSDGNVDALNTAPEQSFKVISSSNNEEQENRQSSTMHPHVFTSPMPEKSVHPAAGPLAAPAAAQILHMDMSSMQRSSVSSTSSSAFHLSTNGHVMYPHAEMGIPHMPALVLSSASAPIHANGYHTIPSALSSVQPSQIGGKRRIYLRLVEDVNKPESSLFSSFRKRSILRKNPSPSPICETEPSTMQTQSVDRGSLTVSWYEGTHSMELHEHVRCSVIRKLRLQGTTKLADFRILDDSVNPPEEIVLSPYIPSGSKLLLRFTTKDAGGEATPVFSKWSDYNDGPPESPSAAPSPHPKMVDLGGLGLNGNQLALLGARLKGLQMPSPDEQDASRRMKLIDGTNSKQLLRLPNFKLEGSSLLEKGTKKTEGDKIGKNDEDEDQSKEDSNMEVASLHPEDPVQKSLREITDLLIAQRSEKQRHSAPHQENRQVIFVLANYFVLFLSLIAISAEIQARAPEWQAAMERQFKNVQDCSKDKESLFECVENGDFAGLIASVLLWISRSAATKRIFLFGFESPKRLWTVVYESLVTAVCWGFSYIFIRRGMNPDTNRNFIQKYWKDAVYGSLAGFNAAFMKHVLKNLIPQEAIEDALQDRQLKILSWLPSFS